MKTPVLLFMAISCISLLAACSTVPPVKDTSGMYMDEVGTVRTAVISVAPWKSFQDLLQPKFNLSLKDALAESIATTRRSNMQQMLNTAVNLGIGLNKGESEANNTNNTSNSVSETAAGGESGAGATGSGNTTDTQKPGIAKPDYTKPMLAPEKLQGDVAIDPRLHYQAAMALYQEIEILDRYIKNAVTKENYTSYLVRLQFTLMPRQHDLPLDAYVNLSFFPKGKINTNSNSQNLPKRDNGITIVPLIATSNYESSLSSAVLQQIQGLKLAVQSLSGTGTGNGANIANLSEEIKSALARDINNTFIIGRLNDNSIRVKIGALQELSSRYSMVPRTEYATVMMLVPDKMKVKTVQINSYSEIVNTLTGKSLKYKPESREIDDIEAILKDYFDIKTTLVFPEDSGVVVDAKEFTGARHFVDYLWGLMLENNYTDFSQQLDRSVCMESLNTNDPDDGVIKTNKFKEVFEGIMRNKINDDKDYDRSLYCNSQGHYLMTKNLWKELVYLQPGYISDILVFDLPLKKASAIFPDQTAILTDNNKTASNVTLYDGKNLQKQNMCALLTVEKKDGAIWDTVKNLEIPASAINISDDETTGTFVFPSLQKLGVIHAPENSLQRQKNNNQISKPKPHTRKPKPGTDHEPAIALKVAWSEDGENACLGKLAENNDAPRSTVINSQHESDNNKYKHKYTVFYNQTQKNKTTVPNIGYQVNVVDKIVAVNGKGEGILRIQFEPKKDTKDKKLDILIDGAIVKSANVEGQNNKKPTIKETGNFIDLENLNKRAPFSLDMNLKGLADDEEITVSIKNGNKGKANDIKVKTKLIAKAKQQPANGK